jgi:stress response protein YsnF
MKFSKLTPQDQVYKSWFGDIDVHHFEIFTHEGDRVGKVIGSLAQFGQCYLAAEVGSWLLRRELAIPLTDYHLLSQQQQISISSADRYRAVELVPGQVLAEPLAADLALSTAEQPEQLALAQPVINQPASNQLAETASYSKVDDLGQIQLFEERVAVDMQQRKLGEVIVRKVIETEIIEIPVRREKLVIEQISPTYQQLAAVDLSQLKAVELHPPSNIDNDISSDTSNDVDTDKDANLETNTNSDIGQLLDSSSSRLSLQVIPVTQATKILIYLSQNPEFSGADVKLQFEDPLLQARYQQWLSQD